MISGWVLYHSVTLCKDTNEVLSRIGSEYLSSFKTASQVSGLDSKLCSWIQTHWTKVPAGSSGSPALLSTVSTEHTICRELLRWLLRLNRQIEPDVCNYKLKLTCWKKKDRYLILCHVYNSDIFFPHWNICNWHWMHSGWNLDRLPDGINTNALG